MEWWKSFFTHDYYGDSLEVIPQERTIAETEFMLSALQLEPGARVLDLCCGMGRHTIDIARHGHRVTGLDLSEEYLEAARANAAMAGVDADFVKADMRRIPKGRKYDAVINVFSSFGYFDKDAENFKVFAAVAGCLKKDGRFFLETLSRDWLIANFTERDWFEDENGMTIEEREFDPKEDVAITRWRWIRNSGRISEHESRVKLYPYSTLKRELEKRGLEIEYAFGDYDGSEFCVDSGRMILVARK